VSASVPAEPTPLPTALPAKDRWRVAVLGNSLPILMVPGRANRLEGAYPELLERALRERQVDVRVDCHARLYDLAHEGARRWLRDVVPSAPDVVILNYGVLEAQPNVLPTTINRHLTREDRGGPGVGGMWMRRVVPRLWPKARAYQRWAATRAGMHTWRMHPDRLRTSLGEIVQAARRGKSLVLVVDVLPPGDRLRHFFPHIDERVAVVNDALRALVEDADSPEVRLFEASAIAVAMGPESVPDGLHLVPEGHRRMAMALADEIEEWIASVT
jgi:lysophospholipase L1-like esterase